MKNHKGQQKAFDRYVDSELYDDYLDDYADDDDYSYYSNTAKLDELEAKLFQKAPSKLTNNKPPSKNEPKTTTKKPSNNPAPVPVAKLDKHLTSQMIRDLALLIGPEAKNCYFNLKEIQPLKNTQVLQTFRDLYHKFETVPVLFLSLVFKDNAQVVYLWQINKKCPYQKGTDIMVLDSKSQKLDVMPHPSLLVLAKIKPLKGEQILDAKLINDHQLLVKSRKIDQKNSATYYVFRMYKVKDFWGTSKVNPYREEILAGDVFSYELQIKFHAIPSTINSAVPNSLEFSLFRRTNVEDLSMMVPSDNNPLDQTQSIDKKKLIEMKTCDYPGTQNSWLKENIFSELIYDETQQRFFMFDKETSTVLRWQANDIAVEHNSEVKELDSVVKIKDDIFFTSNNAVYKLDTETLKLIFTDTDMVTYPILLENIISQPRKFHDFVTFCNEPYAIMLVNTIFRSVPIGKHHHKDLCNIKDHLKTSKTLSWTTYMMESETPILVYICNNFLYIKNLFWALDSQGSAPEEKIIILPSESSSLGAAENASPSSIQPTNKITDKNQKGHHLHKEFKQSWDWEILGFSSKKLYLCKKFLNQQSVQLVEMSFDVSINRLFSEDFIPDFQQIKKEDYYLLPFDGKVSAQMDRKEEIVFVSFENEPFYNDEVNLMYNVPMSLKNPQEIEEKAQIIKEEKKTEDNDKENKNYFKKMEKAKVEISHKKDINQGLEVTKEALKSLRGNISTKMGEVQEFNKKYLDQEKNPKKEKVKLNDPGKVNIEGVQLYQEIKTEKKKMNKQRDKEKTKRHKGDLRSQY